MTANPDSIVVQRAVGRPQQLILLFHGVGASPHGLVPVAQRLAGAFADATIVSVAAPHASFNPGGRQWFSVQGISEENRAERIAQALPLFVAEVQAWQRSEDATPSMTALVGFSQGAIMSLEATRGATTLAGRVVAIAGRYAALPEHAPTHTTLHLIHGKSDPVVPYRHTVEAAHRLIELGGDVTADVLPFVQHEINAEMVELAIERLQGHIPKRLWDEAMQAPGANADP